MSSSFDYRIDRMSPEKEEEYNQVRGGGPGQIPAYTFKCSGHQAKRPCHGRVKWHCSYVYVTGKSGRTTTCDRNYCDNHARKFCQAHDLALPPALAELELEP